MLHLTLTRVVFELNGKSQKLGILCNLTLTRVVFESSALTGTVGFLSLFNFNKSCI